MLRGQRIAVTGHTSGIGKEIYEYCQFHGADVKGYSRSNGFDLRAGGDDIINDILKFDADIVNETLMKTNLENLNKSSKVNLERALQYNQRVGGHLVQGHIDTVGKIVNIDKTDEWTEIMIELDSGFKKYCIYKGSIAVDGVSLTIANINENVIKIALIPHTLDNTISSDYSDGQFVNIETDMHGKYIENFSREMIN